MSQNKTIGQVFKSLAASRKFWLAALGVVASVSAYAAEAIDGDTLVTAIVALASVVIAAIAHEDAAAKGVGVINNAA